MGIVCYCQYMKNIQTKSSLIGVIADDLTSAADGAGPFLDRGLKVNVQRPGFTAIGKWSADVISIDCGSRSMDAKQAADAVRLVCQSISKFRILLKTIDSTLRGHVKPELEAAYLASGRKQIVIAPAFPDAGRTTQNGIQLVDGIPVSKSIYANDPVHPAKTSKITDLIPASVKSAVVLDACTQIELNDQVAGFKNPEKILWVGSPGLAIALAALPFNIGKNQHSKSIPHAETSIIVVGSANPVSRMQAEKAEGNKHITCLSTPNKRTENPKAVLSALVTNAANLVKNGQYGALIATGGDTMEALLDRLKIYDFSLVGEFEPGFPLGVATLPDGENLILAMKAGGFGSEETLRLAAEQLRSSKNLKQKATL